MIQRLHPPVTSKKRKSQKSQGCVFYGTILETKLLSEYPIPTPLTRRFSPSLSPSHECRWIRPFWRQWGEKWRYEIL